MLRSGSLSPRRPPSLPKEPCLFMSIPHVVLSLNLSWSCDQENRGSNTVTLPFLLHLSVCSLLECFCSEPSCHAEQRSPGTWRGCPQACQATVSMEYQSVSDSGASPAQPSLQIMPPRLQFTQGTPVRLTQLSPINTQSHEDQCSASALTNVLDKTGKN